MLSGFVEALSKVLSAILIIVRNPLQVERFTCPHSYRAKLGVSPISLQNTTVTNANYTMERGSFWLLGNNDDIYTIEEIKRAACYDEQVPVIVISMHPSEGIQMETGADQYISENDIVTWEQYDRRLHRYSEELGDIPSIVIMEPSLLMRTFYSDTQYHNTEYQIYFASRVDKAANLFRRSWIYVDVGNAMYLQWTVNLEHITSVLKKMPAMIRGFSVNVASFVNTTFNRQIAEEIYCDTGLHYVIDTSRNGGDFSTRPIEEIEECSLDPPYVEKGSLPNWKSGSDGSPISQQLAEILGDGSEFPDSNEGGGNDNDLGVFSKRKKRWTFDSVDDGSPVYESETPVTVGGGAVLPTTSTSETFDYGDYGSYYYNREPKYCIHPKEQDGLDAYIWAKNPGESDGRLFIAGSFHPCLLGHSIECSPACPMYLQKVRGRLVREEICKCTDE